jgi:hypothetical protein
MVPVVNIVGRFLQTFKEYLPSQWVDRSASKGRFKWSRMAPANERHRFLIRCRASTNFGDDSGGIQS